jgi:hypothetical protein
VIINTNFKMTKLCLSLFLFFTSLFFPNEAFSIVGGTFSPPGQIWSFETATIPSKGTWTLMLGGGYVSEAAVFSATEGPSVDIKLSRSFTDNLALSASYYYYRELNSPSADVTTMAVRIGGRYSPAILKRYIAPGLGIGIAWGEGGTILSIHEGFCFSIPLRLFTPFLSADFFTSIPVVKNSLPILGSDQFPPSLPKTYDIPTTFGPQVNIGARFAIPLNRLQPAFYLVTSYNHLFSKNPIYFDFYHNIIILSFAGGIEIAF